jgi:SET domain-containing protein
LYIKEVEKKGRGVFRSVPVAAGELIELCPMLIFSRDDFEKMKFTFIINYCFLYNQAEKVAGLATGFGSLYNHSTPANAFHKINKEEKSVSIFAVRDIAAHEEICINYHGEYNSEATIWFTSRGIEYHP